MIGVGRPLRGEIESFSAEADSSAVIASATDAQTFAQWILLRSGGFGRPLRWVIDSVRADADSRAMRAPSQRGVAMGRL